MSKVKSPRGLRPFYRKLYITHLIEDGKNSVPMITEMTGLHRRSVQDLIAKLDTIGIICISVKGESNQQHFEIKSWGYISSKAVKKNLPYIRKISLSDSEDLI